MFMLLKWSLSILLTVIGTYFNICICARVPVPRRKSTWVPAFTQMVKSILKYQLIPISSNYIEYSQPVPDVNFERMAENQWPPTGSKAPRMVLRKIVPTPGIERDKTMGLSFRKTGTLGLVDLNLVYPVKFSSIMFTISYHTGWPSIEIASNFDYLPFFSLN